MSIFVCSCWVKGSFPGALSPLRKPMRTEGWKCHAKLFLHGMENKKVFYPIFLVVLSYYDGWKGRIFAVGINDTGV